MREEREVKYSGGGAGPLSRALACALTLAVLAPGPACAARIYPSAGSTSAAFLKLGVGARAVAMGGAFSGVPGDPYAIYWNPAGLAYLDEGKNAGLFHNEYFQGLGQEFLFYTVPASEVKLPLAGRARSGVYGLGLDYFYTPKDMERRSGLYEADPVNPISPVEGKFGAYDLAFSAGYGWRAREDLALGAALKVIRQSIDDESGSSLALDLGLLKEFTRGGVPYTAGFTVQNLGPGIKFVSRRYGLPLVFKAGLSRPLPGPGGLLALELAKPVDNYPSVAVGVEYPLTGRLALRSGYRLRQHGNELGAWSGFSAGAGVAFDKVSLDYAFSPFGDLGNSHRFSVNVRFGALPRAVPVRAAPAPAPLPAGAVSFLFRSSPRALTLSTRGVKYAVKAAAEGCALASVSFTTLLRGEAPAEFRAVEGGLPGELAAGLPAGLRPAGNWRLDDLPGSVQGDIIMEFKLPAGEAGPGEAALLYREGAAWKEVKAARGVEADGSVAFSARAPQSEYYVLGFRE